MRYSIAVALAACAATASAFADTHPFWWYSTETHPGQKSLESHSIISANDLTSSLLNGCPQTDNLLIITLGGLNVADFSKSGAGFGSVLKSATRSAPTKSFSIPEVVGEIQQLKLVADLIANCGYTEKTIDVKDLDSFEGFKKGEKAVVAASLKPVPAISGQTDENAMADRKKILAWDESILSDLMTRLSDVESYAIMFFGTGEVAPASKFVQQHYRSDEGKAPSNSTYTNLPLFERYQFFTPGLFMGLGVTLLLLAILSVGIRAISSLQVSYAAFEKESGPGVKKQQ